MPFRSQYTPISKVPHGWLNRDWKTLPRNFPTLDSVNSSNSKTFNQYSWPLPGRWRWNRKHGLIFSLNFFFSILQKTTSGTFCGKNSFSQSLWYIYQIRIVYLITIQKLPAQPPRYLSLCTHHESHSSFFWTFCFICGFLHYQLLMSCGSKSTILVLSWILLSHNELN